MTATELGACEWFVWDLRRSNLIERGQLDQVVQDFLKKDPRTNPLRWRNSLSTRAFSRRSKPIAYCTERHRDWCSARIRCKMH